MKFKNYLWLISMALIVGFSLTLVSCGPDDEPDEVSVSMPSVNFGESGGSQSVQVMSNTKWTVSGNPGWLTVAPMQGSNNGAFTISANANSEKESRNCILYINAGSASAVVSVSQSGKVPETRVTIKNNSTLSLNRFTIVFVNNRMEEIDNRDFGTFDPGQTISYDIPTGATEYFMAMYAYSKWWLSANYNVSDTNLSLTKSIIGTWTSSSSVNRYPKASSAN